MITYTNIRHTVSIINRRVKLNLHIKNLIEWQNTDSLKHNYVIVELYLNVDFQLEWKLGSPQNASLNKNILQ